MAKMKKAEKRDENDCAVTPEEASGGAPPETQPSLSFFQMMCSVLRSFFGVQSAKNSTRDFKYGKASQFIMVGILMTIVWYGAISIIVNIVLANR